MPFKVIVKPGGGGFYLQDTADGTYRRGVGMDDNEFMSAAADHAGISPFPHRATPVLTVDSFLAALDARIFAKHPHLNPRNWRKPNLDIDPRLKLLFRICQDRLDERREKADRADKMRRFIGHG